MHSRLWLNRLAEAACSVAREPNFKLQEAQLDAIERFRRGGGPLEWASLGLVFGPGRENIDRHYHQEIAGDRIPIVVHSVQLTEELLRSAAGVHLQELRTVQAERPPLEGGRVRRRPERPDPPDEPEQPPAPEPDPPDDPEPPVPAAAADEPVADDEPTPEPLPTPRSRQTPVSRRARPSWRPSWAGTPAAGKRCAGAPRVQTPSSTTGTPRSGAPRAPARRSSRWRCSRSSPRTAARSSG